MLENMDHNEEDEEVSNSYDVKFINPDLVIKAIGIEEGSIVADFGCGGGYFSLPIAKKIGNGIVYAFDILPQSLEMINGYAKAMGLTNIITKRVNLEKDNGSALDDGCCDWVIMKDMLFQNKLKTNIIKEAYRVLRDGGKVLVIEWDTRDSSIGPINSSRIPKEALMEIIQESGMSVLNEVPVSNFHYGLVLVK